MPLFTCTAMPYLTLLFVFWGYSQFFSSQSGFLILGAAYSTQIQDHKD